MDKLTLKQLKEFKLKILQDILNKAIYLNEDSYLTDYIKELIKEIEP